MSTVETLSKLTKNPKKYLDWRGWLMGLWKYAFKRASDVLLALGATNGAEAMGVEGLGLDLKQAGILFGSTLVLSAIRYLNSQPLPEEQTAPPFESNVVS